MHKMQEMALTGEVLSKSSSLLLNSINNGSAIAVKILDNLGHLVDEDLREYMGLYMVWCDTLTQRSN